LSTTPTPIGAAPRNSLSRFWVETAYPVDADRTRRSPTEGAAMPRALKFSQHGDIDVLEVVEIQRPVPGPGQVLVRMKAAGINPGEASIRKGLLEEVFPTTFPSGEGSDIAGQIEELGPGVEEYAVGDEVIGFTETRSSHADLVLLEVGDLVHRPANVPWEVGGTLYVAGTTAYATVQAVGVDAGDVVVVSGAAGGVGSIAVQLAAKKGAKVIGLASAANHEWLAAHGVIPVAYGDGVAENIKAAAGEKIDAFIDTFGADYIKLAQGAKSTGKLYFDVNGPAPTRFVYTNAGTDLLLWK
jgi:NADPH:quinone reductase-like Zn-dependent oxidoreductase